MSDDFCLILYFNVNNLLCRMPIMDGNTSSKWPKYSRENQNYFILNGNVAAGTEITTGLKSGICSFWNEVIGS